MDNELLSEKGKVSWNTGASLVAQTVKNLPAVWETTLIASQVYKKSSDYQSSGKCKSKPTMRYHLTPLG